MVGLQGLKALLQLPMYIQTILDLHEYVLTLIGIYLIYSTITCMHTGEPKTKAKVIRESLADKLLSNSILGLLGNYANTY